jgi:putative photosynthetic complex assembly protein
MSEIDREPFPKWTVWAALGVIVISIGAAAVGAYNNRTHPPQAITSQEPVQSHIDLLFSDAKDGSVLVQNAQTKAVLLTIKPGEDAFIRAVLRGFVRDRNARKLGTDAPFRLYRLVDSRLVIEDTATAKQINLRAFGPTQQAAFARLLPEPPR